MRVRRVLLWLGRGVFLAAVCFLVVQWRVFSLGQPIVTNDDAPRQTVALVFGASVRANGEPSDILEDRLLTAVELYRAETVTRILVSGDNGQHNYDEVNGMRAFLLEQGVAPEDIFLDHAGFDSYDTLVRAKEIFGVRDALLVTQRYHLPRVLYIGKSIGLDVTGVAADRRSYRRIVYFAFREMFANVKAVFDVTVGSRPAVLGEEIPIIGDGRSTWDEDGQE